jgi:para-aminobenzoate N-oxygenase AurF
MTYRDVTQLEVLADLAGSWAAPLGGTALFAPAVGGHDEQTLRLYAKGKQRQWDGAVRLDWSLPVNPDNPLGMPDSTVWIAGSQLWDRLPERERAAVRRHTAAWTYSQLLNGEQLSLIGAAKIVQTVPDLESKFYAATQVIDEARHTEVFGRYIDTKIGVRYGITPSLGSLFENVLTESRWDFAALGVQVLIENMGLASFAVQRELATEPLAIALNSYVMEDEARHVAFGRILLRRYYQDLTAAELAEREQFALEACWALRDRFVGEEMWHKLDYGAQECIALARSSAALREYRRRLFMRIVPAFKDVGLLGPVMQKGLAKMGVLGFGRLEEGWQDRSGDDDEDAAQPERAVAREIASAVLDGRASGSVAGADVP